MTTTTTRQCGACSLCCKLPYVKELGKSIDTWCQHCKPGAGCLIYAMRPTTCRDFVCIWKEGGFSDDWFPAKAKFYLTRLPESILLVTVDPSFPNAWRKQPYYSQLLAIAKTKPLKIRIGRRLMAIDADGNESETTRTQAYLEGREEA